MNIVVFMLTVCFVIPVWADANSSQLPLDVTSILGNVKNPFESKLPLPPVIDVRPPEHMNQIQYNGSNANVTNTVNKVVEPVKPVLTVSGLVWSEEVHQAIVNGQVVGEGDVLNGVKIKKINRDGVKVSSQGREYLFTTP